MRTLVLLDDVIIIMEMACIHYPGYTFVAEKAVDCHIIYAVVSVISADKIRQNSMLRWVACTIRKII